MLGDGYYGRLTDQRGFAQLAGLAAITGHRYHPALADDPEFADIMINSLTALTYERHFFGGDATSFEAIDAG